MNRKILLPLGLLLALCAAGKAQAQDLWSDTWVGTDALGRQMPTSKEAGLTKTDKDRTVGIFYITWHTKDYHRYPKEGFKNVTEVLNEDPNARIDGNSPAWPRGVGSWHWGEPEYGYFLSQDRYVIRHDISMLADAGVDVLILDVTNAVCYWDEWNIMFDIMEQMRKEGNPVPKICFWTYNGPVITITQKVYDYYFKTGKYKDLWFYWDGKPLFLCNMRPELDANGGGVKNPNPHYEELAATDPSHPHYGDPDYAEKYYTTYTKEVRDFFTLRNMWWGYYMWGGERYVGTEDNWSFGYQMNDEKVASLNPQQLAAKHQGRLEEMAVTPAQHPVSITGKSWRRNTKEPTLDEHDMVAEAFVPWLGKTVKNPVEYGIYFQDRWDEALVADPDFLYLNDWNEWTAGKYTIGKAPGQETPGPTTFLGRTNNTFYFVDQYNAEFNRTIQPMKGGYTDNYYMQMAQNIRKYKGVRAIPEYSGLSTITLDGEFNDWAALTEHFLDTRGDIAHRDHDGYAGRHYVNTTGRNDIVEAKVAVDKKNIYFYAETANELSPSTDPNWMLLFIDADRNDQTGWHGYDYVVNYGVKDGRTTTVKRYDTKTQSWVEVGQVPYATGKYGVELSVPRKLLGLKGNKITFDFKWADNPQSLDSPIALCTDGDTAPNRRFNYRYIWKK